MPICGIYKITNKSSGKVYIGQSIDILGRWRDHLQATDNSNFHVALREYGVTDFCFEIIEECNQEQLDLREQYWIQQYQSNTTGYNMTLGGNTGVSTSMSRRTKKVAQYSLDGELIDTFLSVKEAKEQTKVSKIAECCRKERLTAGNFQWRYYDEIPLDSVTAVKAPSSGPKEVTQYLLDGTKLQTFVSIAEASKATKISTSSIISACQGKTFSAGGFRWSYANKSLSNNPPTSGVKKPVLQFDLNGNLIARHESASAAARAVNGSVSSIADACKGKLKTSKNYIWKYE